MTAINTVLGQIDSARLGCTLIHEHLLIGLAGWNSDGRVRFDRAGTLADAVEMLKELKDLGVESIADPCPIDLGRAPRFLAEASERSGVNIIGATGLYHQRLGIPPYYKVMSEDDLAELFVRELRDGMGDTTIRAGIIKTATTADRVSRHEERVHRAAARAQVATGAPIITHTDEKGPMGLEQLRIFQEAGARPGSLAIGHSCGCGNIPYLLDLLRRGTWLSFDRFGHEATASDDVRIATLIGLIGIGFEERIMLSHDSVLRTLSHREIRASGKPDHPKHLFLHVFPRLREAGIADAVIDRIMRDNPRRFFEEAALAAPPETPGVAT